MGGLHVVQLHVGLRSAMAQLLKQRGQQGGLGRTDFKQRLADVVRLGEAASLGKAGVDATASELSIEHANAKRGLLEQPLQLVKGERA